MGCYNSKILLKNLLTEETDKLTHEKFHTTTAGIRLIHASAKILGASSLTNNEFEFTKKDFCNIIEAKIPSKFDKLKKLCKELLRSYVSVETKTSWNVFPIFHSIEYYETNDKVVVRFHESLIPYLKHAGKDVKTEESLNSIMDFKSKYSVLVYDICKKNLNNSDNMIETSIMVDELRSKLQIDEKKYKKYNDFKRKVLLQAQKEINDKSDIYFDIEEETSARKVKGIKFIIKNNSNDKEPNLDCKENIDNNTI